LFPLSRGGYHLAVMATPPAIAYASIGMADSLILLVMALVVFGPRRLPQIGRQMGKLMYEFRKAANDFKFQMEEELRVAEEADRRKREAAAAPVDALTGPAETKPLPAPATEATATDPYANTQVYPPPVEGYASPSVEPAAETAAVAPTPEAAPVLSSETAPAAQTEAQHG